MVNNLILHAGQYPVELHFIPSSVKILITIMALFHLTVTYDFHHILVPMINLVTLLPQGPCKLRPAGDAKNYCTLLISQVQLHGITSLPAQKSSVLV